MNSSGLRGKLFLVGGGGGGGWYGKLYFFISGVQYLLE